MTNEYQQPRYLTAAETARLIRKRLATEFPGQKFYVNSSTYAGGASIRVEWLDGPTRDEVDDVVAVFSGKDFDASIDLACYWNHWLLPDGTVQVARGSGTRSSRGYIDPIDNPKPCEEAELVSLMSDHICTNRYHTRAFVEKVKAMTEAETGNEAPEIVESYHLPTKNTRWETAEFKWNHRDDYWSRYFSNTLHNTSDYQKVVAKSDNGSNGKARVERDRDWLWVYFSAKPEQATIDSLKELGGRWSKKRGGWYLTDASVQNQVEAVVL